MIGKNILNVKILNTSRFILPKEYLVTNEMIHEVLLGINWKSKLDKKKIYKLENLLGLKNRYLINFPRKEKLKDFTSVDLMYEAGKKILKKFDRSKIDLVIGISTTSSKYTTSLGAILAGKLGIKSASLELKSGCASLISALIIASQFVNSTKSNVLILSGETLSKIAKDKFYYHASDAGAAILLGYEKGNSGIEKFYLDSDGAYSDKMGVKGILPPNKKDLEEGNYFFHSDSSIYNVIKKKWVDVPKKIFQNRKLDSSKIKSFISNQVNNELIELARIETGISISNTINLVNKFGNTGQTGFLIALDFALKKRNFSKKDSIYMQAVGGGLSWGGILWRV